MYRNSALSAAGAMLCEHIQREWANFQVQQNELFIQMMLYQVLQSENLVMGEDDETELLELCFLAEWSELQRRCTIIEAADAALMNIQIGKRSIPRKPPVLELRSFNLIDPAFVYHNLRFNLPDLITVFAALDFPPTFKSEKDYVYFRRSIYHDSIPPV